MLLPLLLLQADPLRLVAGDFLKQMEIPFTQSDLQSAAREDYRGSVRYHLRVGVVEIGAKSGKVFGFYREGAPAVGRYSASKYTNDEEAKSYIKKMAARAGVPASWPLVNFKHRSGALSGSTNAMISAVFRPLNEGPFPEGEGNSAEIAIDATTGIVTDFDLKVNVKPAMTGWVISELDAMDQMMHVGDRFPELADGLGQMPQKLFVEWIDDQMPLYDTPIPANPCWRIVWRAPSGRTDAFDFDGTSGGIVRKFQNSPRIRADISNDPRPQKQEGELRGIAEDFLKSQNLSGDDPTRWPLLRGKSTVGFVTAAGIVEVGIFSGDVKRFLAPMPTPSDRPKKFMDGLDERAEAIASQMRIPKNWRKQTRQIADANQTMPYYLAEWTDPAYQDTFGLKNSFQVKLDGRDGHLIELRNIDNLVPSEYGAKLSPDQAMAKFQAEFRRRNPKVDWKDELAAGYFGEKMKTQFADMRKCSAIPRSQIIRLGIDRPLRAHHFWRASNLILDDSTGEVTTFDAWGDLP